MVDVKTASVMLFKFSSLILALVLGMQLIRSQLPFPFDITAVFTFEQFVFVYSLATITILAFVEGRTLQKRDSFNFGVLVLYIISAIGAYFLVQIFVFGYAFNDSTINIYMGYYLLVGVIMIVVNARDELLSLRKK